LMILRLIKDVKALGVIEPPSRGHAVTNYRLRCLPRAFRKQLNMVAAVISDWSGMFAARVKEWH